MDSPVTYYSESVCWEAPLAQKVRPSADKRGLYESGTSKTDKRTGEALEKEEKKEREEEEYYIERVNFAGVSKNREQKSSEIKIK
ncbi:hypothetical protein E2C01_055189 [Portunus trituberculatus]|uniref:Uncharacterized protein n=1 Tax=Portunus trituberculatus TaxID=210409 RepID=A0A5B7GUL8_PORTR|nr:hypothetical protein [Portunus trituberculatus]